MARSATLADCGSPDTQTRSPTRTARRSGPGAEAEADRVADLLDREQRPARLVLLGVALVEDHAHAGARVNRPGAGDTVERDDDVIGADGGDPAQVDAAVLGEAAADQVLVVDAVEEAGRLAARVRQRHRAQIGGQGRLGGTIRCAGHDGVAPAPVAADRGGDVDAAPPPSTMVYQRS